MLQMILTRFIMIVWSVLFDQNQNGIPDFLEKRGEVKNVEVSKENKPEQKQENI